jgi:hypothetical protein
MGTAAPTAGPAGEEGPDRPTDEEIHAAAAEVGERFEHLAEAAYRTELASGSAEETIVKARRSLVVRLAIIVGGTFVLLLGLALLALPGPGLVVVALGLGLLASEIPFAARLLERVKRRLPQDEDGKLPRSAIVMMVAMCVLATGASLVWTFRHSIFS